MAHYEEAPVADKALRQRIDELGRVVKDELGTLSGRVNDYYKEHGDAVRKLHDDLAQLRAVGRAAREQIDSDGGGRPGVGNGRAGYSRAEAARLRTECAKYFQDIALYRVKGTTRWNRPEELMRAQNEGTGAAGLFLVPPEQLNFLTALQYQYGVSLGLLTHIPMPRLEMRVPVMSDLMQVYYPDEGAAPTVESAVPFTAPTLTLKRAMAVNTITMELEADSIPSIAAVLVDNVALSFARAKDTLAFVAKKTPGSYPFDGLLQVATGVNQYVMAPTNTSYDKISYGDLLGLLNSVSPFVLSNAGFVLSSSLVNQLRGITDGYGRPLWAEMTSGDPNKLFGYALHRSEVMPATSDALPGQTDSAFILFGDFSKHAMGEHADGLMVDFDRSYQFAQGNVVMRGFDRIAYQLLMNGCIARLRTAAA